MNRTLILFFFLLSIGSATAYHQIYQTNDIVKNDESFDIKLQIDKIDISEYNLAVTIELDNGSYVISPYSKDSVYGHFNISIGKNNNFNLGKMLKEIPTSIEEIDPILNEPVKFVRQNTTYVQKLSDVKKDDFEVSGLIEFVLEPSCIPYDVEFTISNRSGVMKIEKTKTSISKEYKG